MHKFNRKKMFICKKYDRSLKNAVRIQNSPKSKKNDNLNGESCATVL